MSWLIFLKKNADPSSIAHLDENGNAFVESDNDDNSDKRGTTVAVVLTVTILILIFCILCYCAYV